MYGESLAEAGEAEENHFGPPSTIIQTNSLS